MDNVNIKTALVSVKWLLTHSKASNLIILDATINKEIEIESERILNARFFDIKKKFSDVTAPFPSTLPSEAQFQQSARELGINTNSAIVVYDDKGIYSSARVWWLFRTFGYHNVAVLDGGLPEWKLKGFKVENYTNQTYKKGNFKAHYNPILMTNFDGVNSFLKASNTLIIDARSAARFNCEVDEPREGLRRGTIPNSKNLPYTNLFNGNCLKSKEELSKIFNNLVKEKAQLLFSCGSGITACVVALAAVLCDYKNLVVYDGSWTEYGALTN